MKGGDFKKQVNKAKTGECEGAEFHFVLLP